MSVKEACNHYLLYGQYENRKYKIKNIKLPFDFDVKMYQELNEDLKHLKYKEAILHYIKYGKYEGRKYIK